MKGITQSNKGSVEVAFGMLSKNDLIDIAIDLVRQIDLDTGKPGQRLDGDDLIDAFEALTASIRKQRKCGSPRAAVNAWRKGNANYATKQGVDKATIDPDRLPR